MNDEIFGHYRLLGRLGEGGMGVVHHARDERLGREVALKLLPPGLAGDERARARLVAEARAASALNHPHVLTIYEVGEEGGRVYIAMEYVPGRPLAELIPAGGLPAETVVRYGAQIADALAHAHERGVVHRDVKPSNVLVTPEGRVKVLDFGLAKHRPADAPQGPSLTEAETIVGTPEYLAPEVLRGEAADARSDLWSLGVLLHRMAAGSAPFRGASVYELSAAILNEAPAPLPARVPAGLSAVIARCLTRDPAQRWRSAAEVRAALEALGAGGEGRAPVPPRRLPRPAWAGLLAAALLVALAAGAYWFRGRLPGGRGGAIRSLAVLPLESFSRDPEQAYFADGMTEELITRLAQLGAVRVISRTSVMRFRASTLPLPVIAKQLGADAVIEGSVERSGERVRITAQLVQGATDRHLWARSYERPMQDAITLQDEVAGAIVTEIRGALTPQQTTKLARQHAVDPVVYEAYLRGRDSYQRWTPADARRAIVYYDAALARDPRFAPAYAGRAQALEYLTASRDSLAQARADVDRALALDPGSSEAHATLAQILFELDWKWTDAEREFRRALELNPSNVDAHHQYAHLLMALGRTAESREHSRIALTLDPLSPAMYHHMAWEDFMAGDFEAGAAQVGRTLAIDSTYVTSLELLAAIRLAQGRWDAVEDALVRMQRLGDTVDTVGFRVTAALRAGRKDEALRLLRGLASPAQYPFSYMGIATLYAMLGSRDEAFATFDRAFAVRDYDLLFANEDPGLKPLRSDPRYAALRRRMGLPS